MQTKFGILARLFSDPVGIVSHCLHAMICYTLRPDAE